MQLLDDDLSRELTAELAPNRTWVASLLRTVAAAERGVPVALTAWAGTTDVEVRLQLRPAGVLAGPGAVKIRELVELAGGVWPGRASIDPSTGAVRISARPWTV